VARKGHFPFPPSEVEAGWGSPLSLPEPPLADGIVTLRPWAPTWSDAAALAGAWNDPDIARWTGVPAEPTVAVAARWISGRVARAASGLALDLAVTGLDSAEPVRGEVGLARFDPARRVAEVGFWTAPAWRGRGVAARATAVLAQWALGSPLGLAGVLARNHPNNPASAATLRRAGFTPLGRASASNVDVWLSSPSG